jgi:hypothetical protein
VDIGPHMPEVFVFLKLQRLSHHKDMLVH